MSAVRITTMLCITALVIITGVMVHSNSQDRYVILPQNNSMFIFDRKTAAVNYCTADQCKLVMPYGGAGMPNPNIGMMMSGMPMPQGFTPYINPGSDNTAGMMMSTSMSNPMQASNNPMMMWAYMQAAQAAETSAQKGGFSSLQNQPSWMNIMAMMQPAANKNTNVVNAQSPIVPIAMTSGSKSGKEAKENKAPKTPTTKPAATQNKKKPSTALASSSDEDTTTSTDNTNEEENNDNSESSEEVAPEEESENVAEPSEEEANPDSGESDSAEEEF